MNTVTYFKLILVAGISYLFSPVRAQISEGGTPPSFSMTELNEVPVTTMSAVNVDSLRADDAASRSINKPFRFGFAINVNLGLQNSGTWDTLPNGDKLWRLKIHSDNAFSINLIFNNYWLPEGAQFFVYNEERIMVLGAFTAKVSNNEYRKFSTDLVKGNTIVLEYFEPSYASGGSINVNKVIHVYKSFDYDEQSTGLDVSENCNIDVSCSQGNDWCIEKRAVSIVLVDNNTKICSGCLVNNDREDLTPYYLTAFHCIDADQNGTLSQSEVNDAQTWIFRFNYWKPTCGGSTPNYWVSMTGSSLKASYAVTDFSLVELFSTPLSGLGVFYAGWDRASSAPPSAVGIHHPRGDAMKISLENDSPVSSDFDPIPISANSHWKVIWNNGTTQSGSSGSPLFNNNHKVIGQLHGGWASCSSPSNADYYGRFDVSWNGGGTQSTQLSHWLDPDNTGVTTIGATSPTVYLVNKNITGIANYAAVNHIHIEGNVSTAYWGNNPPLGLPTCPPPNIPFETTSSSNVTVKARSIKVRPGTKFTAGTNTSLIAIDVICNDILAYGDDINSCQANVSYRMANTEQTNENIEIQPNENINQSTESNFKIIPNPNNGEFKIVLSELPSSVSVVNPVGISVYENKHFDTKEINVSLKDAAKGLYIVKVNANGKVLSKKIVID